MIVLIDNYDSFSYNLYQLLGSVDPDIEVFRNDAVSIDELRALDPDAIVLSPGPGRPDDAGICEEAVLELGTDRSGDPIPILGVCLGHQAIVEAFGGTVGYAKKLMHGKSSNIVIHEGSAMLDGVPQGAQVARYHSLAATGLPDCLAVAAEDEGGEVMAVEHRRFPVFGLQFHPESIMTPDGKRMIEHFMRIAQEKAD